MPAIFVDSSFVVESICQTLFQVHCISTEFTPKKHGGERGVPFRLQIETFSSDSGNCRLHAGACILQVFKLKGADRKHKQDRDKISKRPVS